MLANLSSIPVLKYETYKQARHLVEEIRLLPTAEGDANSVALLGQGAIGSFEEQPNVINGCHANSVKRSAGSKEVLSSLSKVFPGAYIQISHGQPHRRTDSERPRTCERRPRPFHKLIWRERLKRMAVLDHGRCALDAFTKIAERITIGMGTPKPTPIRHPGVGRDPRHVDVVKNIATRDRSVTKSNDCRTC